jgi:hypothetical protein
MRNLLLFTILSSIVAFCACGSGKEDPDSPKAISEAADCGKADALKVIKAPSQSMEREDAILFIRSRESQLRAAGYVHAADSYIEAAETMLRDSLIIE